MNLGPVARRLASGLAHAARLGACEPVGEIEALRTAEEEPRSRAQEGQESARAGSGRHRHAQHAAATARRIVLRMLEMMHGLVRQTLRASSR